MDDKKEIIEIIKQANAQKNRLDLLLNTKKLTTEQELFLEHRFLKLSTKINKLLDTALSMSDAEQPHEHRPEKAA